MNITATKTETIHFINNLFARKGISCETFHFDGRFVVLFDHSDPYHCEVFNNIAVSGARRGIDIIESPFPQTVEGWRAEEVAMGRI